MLRRRLATVLAVLVLPAGGLVACGDDEGPAERPSAGGREQAPPAGRDVAATLREAYRRTRAEGTAQATYRVVTRPGGQVALEAEGPSDLRRTNARLAVRLGPGGGGAGAGDAIDVHVSEEGAYVRLPGAGWQRAPQDAAGFSTGLDALSWLGGVTDDARAVGPRRYRATIDLGRVAENLPRAERERYREELRRRFRTAELPAEIALDAQGRVARFAVDLPAAALRDAPGGAGQALRVEVALARFGVEVPDPPAVAGRAA
jgi:hypothetical protein